MTARRWRIGVISDTHGLLRPEAVQALRGVDRIVHAGDIGSPDVLRGLEAIAPVTAVRGNSAPDVAYMFGSWSPNIAEIPQVVNMAEYVKQPDWKC